MSALLVAAMLAAAPAVIQPPGVDAPLFDRGNRVRFGTSVQGGMRTLAPSLVMDVELRLGFQATQWWSVFGLAKGNFATGGAASVIGMIGAIVEVMITNHFYFGVGPVLGYGAFSGLDFESRTAQVYSESAGSSLKPGFDVRLGLSIAMSKPPRFSRAGLSLGLELIGLYHSALATTSGVGFGTPTPISPWWVFTPMISIGIDSR